ncbi:hypothetical protein DFAR_2590008 [Desulfarculales bacterium]
MLGLARTLRGRQGQPIKAFLLGPGLEGAVAKLVALGLDKVVTLERIQAWRPIAVWPGWRP